MRQAALLLTAILCGAPPVLAQQRSSERSERSDREFRWEGAISSGRWLYIRNLNGPVRVDRASGNRVEVTAQKRWRRGNPEEVRIETKRIGSRSEDVLICAIWFDTTDCDEDGYHSHDRGRNNNNNDVMVEFTVRLPDGVKLDASTVNGDVEIDGATSTVEAHTTNGQVKATSSGGPVNASTVNGGVEVRMGEMGDGDLTFETVNGSVIVYVPDGLNAEVDMRTLNGHVESDFPMTVSGRISPRHIRATIGRGGRKIEFRTVNGSVELRRR